MQMLVDARFDRVDGWWSGGRDTMNDIIAAGKCDELESLAEATFGYMADNGEYPTVTDVNDWLWFERDSIYSELGIGDDEDFDDEDEDFDDEDDDSDDEDSDDEDSEQDIE